jgi:pyrimidine operon attenuation protein/uracil phosphoribosyltransferase
MTNGETQLADGEALASILDDLARAIADARHDSAPLALVGVRTRGVPIALRLAERLSEELGTPVPVGAVDITLYRDDLGRGDRWPVLKGTEIPFAVEGTDIVLVDDVLFTGRTVRAALNSVCDLGRPARVRLAVVVDRGGRELPIEATHVGLVCQAGPAGRVLVRIAPVDPADEIVRSGPGSPG